MLSLINGNRQIFLTFSRLLFKLTVCSLGLRPMPEPPLTHPHGKRDRGLFFNKVAGVDKEQFSCIGRSVPKIDALDKVLGRAVYSEDITFPGMLYGRVLRAGIPHALVEEIDTREARAMKGVACVLTATDIPGLNRFGIAFQDQEALVTDRIRYIGDPVALVAAETDEIAREAIRAIRVKYRTLPAITSPREALAPDAVKYPRKRESPAPYKAPQG